MNEAEIRMQAQLYALVAEMQAVIVGVEGMKAANIERENQGYALAYDEKAFVDASVEIETLAARMRDEI